MGFLVWWCWLWERGCREDGLEGGWVGGERGWREDGLEGRWVEGKMGWGEDGLEGRRGLQGRRVGEKTGWREDGPGGVVWGWGWKEIGEGLVFEVLGGGGIWVRG